jgi:serine/threonine protein kinase
MRAFVSHESYCSYAMTRLFSNEVASRGNSAEPRLEAGGQLGSYKLLRLLGQGRMGIVFQARREGNGAAVALKVLRDELVGDQLYRRRFEREARIASELDHDHVVPVLDWGEAAGHLYLAALYVPGVSLSERIASRGALTVKEAVRLATDLAGALEALRLRGLVHRDVKPANVLLDERGAGALTDFGLARSIAETVLTRTGAVVGTVDYLAPELIRGERASHSSDIYALGCLVYECLSGSPPFADKPYVEALVAHVTDEPADLSDLLPDLPEGIGSTVLRALAKDPAQRPGTASEFSRLLQASAKTGQLGA